MTEAEERRRFDYDHTGRTPQDYAIEHGGYLANAARYLLNCLNELDAARLTHEERDDDASRDDLECAGETATGARTGLRDAIYEFEKRRDRALGVPTCARSHPHENMSEECERLTVITRQENAASRGVWWRI